MILPQRVIMVVIMIAIVTMNFIMIIGFFEYCIFFQVKVPA